MRLKIEGKQLVAHKRRRTERCCSKTSGAQRAASLYRWAVRAPAHCIVDCGPMEHCKLRCAATQLQKAQQMSNAADRGREMGRMKGACGVTGSAVHVNRQR
jgi:hypothetical protein